MLNVNFYEAFKKAKRTIARESEEQGIVDFGAIARGLKEQGTYEAFRKAKGEVDSLITSMETPPTPHSAPTPHPQLKASRLPVGEDIPLLTSTKENDTMFTMENNQLALPAARSNTWEDQLTMWSEAQNKEELQAGKMEEVMQKVFANLSPEAQQAFAKSLLKKHPATKPVKTKEPTLVSRKSKKLKELRECPEWGVLSTIDTRVAFLGEGDRVTHVHWNMEKEVAVATFKTLAPKEQSVIRSCNSVSFGPIFIPDGIEPIAAAGNTALYSFVREGEQVFAFCEEIEMMEKGVGLEAKSEGNTELVWQTWTIAELLGVLSAGA